MAISEKVTKFSMLSKRGSPHRGNVKTVSPGRWDAVAGASDPPNAVILPFRIELFRPAT
jgi:hypothetical protein